MLPCFFLVLWFLTVSCSFSLDTLFGRIIWDPDWSSVSQERVCFCWSLSTQGRFQWILLVRFIWNTTAVWIWTTHHVKVADDLLFFTFSPEIQSFNFLEIKRASSRKLLLDSPTHRLSTPSPTSYRYQVTKLWNVSTAKALVPTYLPGYRVSLCLGSQPIHFLASSATG